MLVDDPLLHFTGSDIGIADEQGDLVVLVQVGPQLLGEGIDVGGDGHTLGLALEGGDHGVAVADIGVQEVAQAGSGGVRLGFVVDMIETEFITFPVFNVADCFITCGCIAIITSLILFNKEFWKDEKKK